MKTINLGEFQRKILVPILCKFDQPLSTNRDKYIKKNNLTGFFLYPSLWLATKLQFVFDIIARQHCTATCWSRAHQLPMNFCCLHKTLLKHINSPHCQKSTMRRVDSQVIKLKISVIQKQFFLSPASSRIRDSVVLNEANFGLILIDFLWFHFFLA